MSVDKVIIISEGTGCGVGTGMGINTGSGCGVGTGLGITKETCIEGVGG